MTVNIKRCCIEGQAFLCLKLCPVLALTDPHSGNNNEVMILVGISSPKCIWEGAVQCV